MTIKIANGAGFLGDNLDAPRILVEAAKVDYLTLEYLAELTMSILARQWEKDPALGYARDFLEVLKSLVPALRSQRQLKIVTNAGGANPVACAKAAGNILSEAGMPDVRIGVVTGDDVRPEIVRQEIFIDPSVNSRTVCRFENLDTGQPLAELQARIASANAYLGARPIVDALADGAQIVITGRVADASLTVGPAMYEFRRTWDDWNFLAGASVAGHLIECGAQVTGGLYRHWQNLNLAEVGYPIAEISGDGSCVISKPAGSGGVVNRHTVAEQLVYEIGDPARYLTPDVVVDFTSVDVEQIGPDRVRVHGATGQAPTDTYKVSVAYDAGYTASGQLVVYGQDCVGKARACGEMILQRVERAGFKLEHTLVECLGASDAVPSEIPPSPFPLLPLLEVVLRVSVHDSRREAVERFSKEFAPLITSGPPGLAGYAAGRPPVRLRYAYWPTLIPKHLLPFCHEVRVANEWQTVELRQRIHPSERKLL
jgi:Acyclic terpene utilisation family protein AtuA